MIKTDKLLPLINKINQDKKKLNSSKPKYGLPDKAGAKMMSKPIITNQDGQDLFPGMPTLIKGKGAGTSITMRNTNPQIALTPYGASFMQPNMNYNFAGNSVLELPVAQMGGDPQQDQLMQMIQIYAQMKQMDPNELMQKIQSLPQDQQQQALQSISQEVQQAMAQQQQAGQEGQEQMPEEGMMSQGGEPCIDCFDNYNPSPQAQDLNWYYNKAKQELPKHQFEKSQVGKPKLGDFQVGLGKFDADQFRKSVISTQPAATGSGTSVPYNMEEDLKMQQVAAQKMAAYHNNDRSFDSTYFANSIPMTMQNMVEGTSIQYPIEGSNGKRHDRFLAYPANYFEGQREMIDRYPQFENEGQYYKNGDNSRYVFNSDEIDHGPNYIPLNIFTSVRDQRNPQEIRQGQQAAYDAWQKGDKLTKSYLSNDQINDLAQRMASGQNFSNISYEEMLSVPDLKKVQEAATKLGKKAKGGRALPKHQFTGPIGNNNLVNSTEDAIAMARAPRGSGLMPENDIVYNSAKQRYINLLGSGRSLNQMEQIEMRNLVGQFPKLSSDPSIKQTQVQTQAQQKFQNDINQGQIKNLAKSAQTVKQKLEEEAAKKQAELKRSLRPGNTTMSKDNTRVASADAKSQELANDIKNYGSFENADMAKAVDAARRQQSQSQLYETIDINPNEYALAAMSSPYTGNDPRIIRDAANRTNKGMAPPAAGLLGAATLPALSHGIHHLFGQKLLPSVIPGARFVTAGNIFTVDMLTDAYERSPAWGNALDKAMKTGSKADVDELLRLSALQGLDISAIAGIPNLISTGLKLPKSLQKLRDLAQTTKFAQTVKEFEGLIHAGKKAVKSNLKEEIDPTTGKWGRYAEALIGPDGIMGTNPNNPQVPDQTFIPESTGIYPNYLNIPASVATDYYGSRKVGGEAFPQANEYPTDWASYHGNQYMEGGEAFPQAQTYLPYSRLRRFAQGGPDKPVKGKMDPSGGEMSEQEILQYEAERAAQQAAAQAEQAEMNQALGYGFYNFDDYVQPYKGMVTPNPSSIPSNQNSYTTAPYFGSSDRYSQVTRPVNLQGAQEIELLRPTQGISGAYGMTPVQTTQPVASTQTSPQTSPVVNPPSPGSITIDDSNINIKPAPKTGLAITSKFTGTDSQPMTQQDLRKIGFTGNIGLDANLGRNWTTGINATYGNNIVVDPNGQRTNDENKSIAINAGKTWDNGSMLKFNAGLNPVTKKANADVQFNYMFGNAEKRDGGSFETRPNFMFAEGGDIDDQFGGQLDMDSIYRIMKAGGLAKDPKKKKGKELSPADFMAYVRSQALKKKVGGEMLPKHDVVGQTGAVYENNPDGSRKYGYDPNKYPEAYGHFKDPTGNADWTYSYNNGEWTAYDKAGKSYNISKNPKYKTSVDKLNAAYPGGKDPNAVTNNTSNPANTNTGNTTTNQGTTTNEGAPAGNTTTSANPSGAISANPLDYLNMVNSQTGNKGIVGALTSVANAANLVGYLGTGWGSGEKKEKEKKPQTPNIPIQQQNENKQAKANLTQKVNEYKNDYVYPQSTPEVDPLAGGDFMSSMDSQYPMQQNYTSGYDAYRMQEDGKNPTAMQPKQASTLYTTQDNSTVKRSPKVPLTGPYMRPQDRPSPYEQWKEDVNDPNNLNYQFNERGDGVSGVKNPMSIDAYPFDFYQPVNDNPYQRSYRRGGDIYLPKHSTDPIVVSGMQGQGQSTGTNSFNLYSTQTPAAIQNSAGYQAVQTANQDATRIADQNVTAQGTDTTGGTPSTTTDNTQKSAAPKFRPGVMDFGEVGSNGKHLTFDVAGASRAVGGLGQIKDYLAGINQEKQADKLAAKLNTSEFMGMAQMGGMQDMGDYLVNATQGPSFRPNAYTQAQKQSEVRMEQPLLYGRMGGSLDMYEDGEEYDLTQEEIDQILAAGGTVEYI